MLTLGNSSELDCSRLLALLKLDELSEPFTNCS